MAKGGGRSGGGRGKSSSPFSGQGMGLMGGVFTTQQCTPESTSWYCTLSKVVGTIQMVLFLMVISYIIYKFSKILIKGKK